MPAVAKNRAPPTEAAGSPVLQSLAVACAALLEQTRSIRHLFTSRKLAVLFLLGFYSGLPYNLTADTLQAWLTGDGIALETVGLITLVGLPYALKFLWSPLVDRFSLPVLGRRRSWLLSMQLAMAGALATMAAFDPHRGVQAIAALALLIAIFSATQDVAYDAYKSDVLLPAELGNGAALGVLGYRLALLFTSAFAFKLAEWISWPRTYLWLAALMAVGTFATLWAPEAKKLQPPESIGDAVRLPLIEFFSRSGTGRAAAILVFIVLYKLGDTLATRMATPFLIQTGFRLGQIGDIKGGVGFFATALGLLAGGAILGRLGINRSLWVFGILQAASNFGYVLLAFAGKNALLLAAVVSVENGCAGLGTAAFVAFLISLCDPRYSATQYALLSSLMAVGGIVLGSTTGTVAQATGWPLFFALTALAAVPGLLLLPIFAPWSKPSPTVAPGRNG
ncbi:AmpG family muropeptide MFS transporter [Gloeobacter kilaueensis]|uniref:Muropeptide transporter n=1 Tax=Gloeobacter kilaueensis (strain ATCC BAA-2537 / CCAP 1431/1 / ULC 316 / JS1) TaxID=1183438 RepID=U5QJC6_GLOK1|nr:AmpG family muropeptide MFS transporter [Gloeobacter kilaueensis]AGY57775.1 muropeptide transporter [Gloeobacter kilaueensis JS1]